MTKMEILFKITPVGENVKNRGASTRHTHEYIIINTVYTVRYDDDCVSPKIIAPYDKKDIIRY